jgi:hypothetical protein
VLAANSDIAIATYAIVPLSDIITFLAASRTLYIDWALFNDNTLTWCNILWTRCTILWCILIHVASNFAAYSTANYGAYC